MVPWLPAAVAGFLLGTAISFVNYLISRRVLRTKPASYPSVSILRMALSVGSMLLVCLLSPRLGWSTPAALISLAAGLTLPSFFFTFLLMKEQNVRSKKTAEETAEEEEHPHG